LRKFLITIRLSAISFAGTARTVVAVGTSSDDVMFLTTVAAAPRNGALVWSVPSASRAALAAFAALTAIRSSGVAVIVGRVGGVVARGASGSVLPPAPVVGRCADVVRIGGGGGGGRTGPPGRAGESEETGAAAEAAEMVADDDPGCGGGRCADRRCRGLDAVARGRVRVSTTGFGVSEEIPPDRVHAGRVGQEWLISLLEEPSGRQTRQATTRMSRPVGAVGHRGWLADLSWCEPYRARRDVDVV